MKDTRPEVLILISHYLPGYKMGGPVTSVANIIDALAQGHRFKVITTDRDVGDREPYRDVPRHKWIRRPNYEIYYVRSNAMTALRLVALIREMAPPIVYLNSLFDKDFSISIIIANRLGLLGKTQLVVAPRGELAAQGLAFSTRRKALYLWVARVLRLYRGVRWHASTEAERDEIVNSIANDSTTIRVALNIATAEDTSVDEEAVGKEKDCDSSSEELRVVYISRISKEKNLIFALTTLRRVNAAVRFDIYGPVTDQYVWDECQQEMARMPPHIRVSYRGVLKREEVRSTFRKYDLFFFPTFGENFGHVVAESLASGTPVLVSDKTPWRNLEAANLGWDFPLDDPERFVGAIHAMAQRRKSERRISKEALRALRETGMGVAHAKKANESLFATSEEFQPVFRR